MIKLSYFIFGYCLYLFFGALIFYELNYLQEKKQHINVNNQIREFIRRNRKCLKGKIRLEAIQTHIESIQNMIYTRTLIIFSINHIRVYGHQFRMPIERNGHLDRAYFLLQLY